VAEAHKFFERTKAIGRVLVECKLIPRQEISMERIKRWMQANPSSQGGARTNRSLVFFRITGLDMEDEPAGAQGVPLSRIRLPPCDPRHHRSAQRPRPDAEIVGGEVSAWRPQSYFWSRRLAARSVVIHPSPLDFCNAAAHAAALINVRSSPDNVLIVRFVCPGPIRKAEPQFEK